MQFKVEKRFSLRVNTHLQVELLEQEKEGKVLNISETGICFETISSITSQEILLSINLLDHQPEQLISLPAKIVWKKELEGNKFQFGAQFLSLDAENIFKIRNFVFNNFAKKASSCIKEDVDNLKLKVEDFFNRDVKQYHQDISAFAREIEEDKSAYQDKQDKLANITNQLLLKGDILEKAIENELYVKKIKQTFRDALGYWFYKSPIMKMALDKPRGYPGDYELFEIIYNNKPLLEEKNIRYYYDKYFLNNAYTMAVRTRKNRMKNILQDFIENTSLESIKLFNIACGPSREIRELLFDPILSSRKKIFFTGLDNDNGALEFSKSALGDLPQNITLRFLHENVLNLSRDKKYYDLIGKQDVIYILGLTEYLPDRIFKKLVFFLAELLNDKGMLVITYKDRDITFPSLPPDWLCNWAFIKRTQEELINVAKSLGENKYSLRIEREGSGSIFFFILTKL